MPTKDGYSYSIAPLMQIQDGGESFGIILLGYGNNYLGTVSIEASKLFDFPQNVITEGYNATLIFSKLSTEPVIVKIGLLYRGELLHENW